MEENLVNNGVSLEKERIIQDGLCSDSETILREWDFAQSECDNGDNGQTNKKQMVALTNERLIVCQEERKSGSYERRKYSYRLEDIKAVNSYKAQGNISRKNPISTICFILAGILGFVGLVSIIVIATSETIVSDAGSNIGLTMCIIGAVVLCGVATLLRMKNDTTMYLVVEIETLAVEKHQLVKASRLVDGSKECDIKRGIILPVNNFTMQFIDEIDNAIVKAQIENKEKREVRIETTKAKGTKGRKKSANSK